MAELGVELGLAVAQARQFCVRETVGLTLVRDEIVREEYRSHEAARLVNASCEDDVADFVGENSSQRTAQV